MARLFSFEEKQPCRTAAGLSFSGAGIGEIAVIFPQDVADERDGQHRIGGDPGHGISGAQGVKRQSRRVGADRTMKK